MTERHGTEIAFRLGPGNDERARAIAGRLAAAARGALGHTLFLNERGEYGCLAEWDGVDAAAGYADEPAVRAVLAELAAELGKEPSVRVYLMERQVPGQGG